LARKGEVRSRVETQVEKSARRRAWRNGVVRVEWMKKVAKRERAHNI